MKLRLTYFLLLFLLFFKGYAYSVSVPRQAHVGHGFISAMQKKSEACFKKMGRVQASLFDDVDNDIEEDDYIPCGKKESLSYNWFVQHRTPYLSASLPFFKSHQWPDNHFFRATSDKYIFIRSLKI